MKYLIICLLFFEAACSGSNNNTVLDGVYTASFEHEFAKTDDTLFLKKQMTEMVFIKSPGIQVLSKNWMAKYFQKKYLPIPGHWITIQISKSLQN